MLLSNAYKIFGISPRNVFTALELKRKYRELIKKYHPDVSEEKDCVEKTQEVVQAYDILCKVIMPAEIIPKSARTSSAPSTVNDEVLERLYKSRKPLRFDHKVLVLKWLMSSGRVASLDETYTTDKNVVYAIKDMDTTHLYKETMKLKNLASIDAMSRVGPESTKFKAVLGNMEKELASRAPVPKGKCVTINFGGSR